MKKAQLARENPYSLFERIDGIHPFKEAVPGGYVDYPVRTRHGGSVAFFNFALAKEMGLIPQDHPDQLNAKLGAKIIATFSLVIINEYDQIHKTPFPKKDIRPNKYMATRYLQLQHPSKRGITSGDGRGIWNGVFKSKGITWDVSSSGTGATCLSPACAQKKKFFKTGDRDVGYGNGYNTLDEGVSAALMSEVFHQNGVGTERTLAIIGFRDGTSINVRVSHCLLRPSHFFHHLKQGAYENLKNSVDFFIDRQISNGAWTAPQSFRDKRHKYEFMAEQMALAFARAAASFESNYIFCWLDWDGDNILANGGIIDYGSVRQFGLYHRGYRYEDVDRYSTNLPEQKAKARYIVQTFAQACDFLITGRKRNIRRYRSSTVLKIFDRHFQETMKDLLLEKIGFSMKHRQHLLGHQMELIEKFQKHFSYFERTQTKRKAYRVPDGITRDAVFCMREMLLEFPKRYLKAPGTLSHEDFVKIIKSSYAKPRDLALGFFRRRAIDLFQETYLSLVREAAEKVHGGNLRRIFLEICMRSSVINRTDRITGDAAIEVTQSLIRNRRRLSANQLYQIIDQLVRYQKFVPMKPMEKFEPKRKGKANLLVLKNIELIQEYREGL